MMIIDVKRLISKGVTEFPFDFRYTPDNNMLSLPNASFSREVEIEGVAEIYDDCVRVFADVTFGIEGECSRCLEKASTVISRRLEEEFSDGEKEDNYFYTNGRLDLTKAVNDLILMNMPYVLLCKEDCKGICPRCGANLNKEKCNH